MNNDQKRYKLIISRMTVDKLGVKLYDKVAVAIAELIANAYDADAENVKVRLPLGKFLATKEKDGKSTDKGYIIEVRDDGHGMTPEEANKFYLKVGPNRRANPDWGARSRIKNRPVLGRKGIGKLAPFGICKRIEVRSAGGEKNINGYEVTHFVMDYDDILSETDVPYSPKPLKDDGTWDKESGTTIRLSHFMQRKTPNAEVFHRKLARSFGIQQLNFKITVIDTKEENPTEPFEIGELPIEKMEGTEINVSNRPIILEDGTKLPVSGWAAYAKESYRNAEVAGIRIYARGKLVAATRDFGLSAGFYGEFTIRSYLVGVIHADWLDDDEREDLIQTHRQDILWDSEYGRAFSEWGQKLIKEVGKKAFKPRRKKARERFMEVSKLEEFAKKRFAEKELQKTVVELGELIGGTTSQDDLKDKDHVEQIREFILSIAPHRLLVESFREASIETKHPLKVLIDIFRRARIAEIASYGQIATERVQAIDRLEKALEDPTCNEFELQKLLEKAPWLINPQWHPISINKTLKTFRKSFERWYQKEYGKEIITTTIETENKRPDFVLLDVGSYIEILEIKAPGHILNSDEFNRLQNYIDAVDNFLKKNPEFKEGFSGGVRATLICDGINLKASSDKRALELLEIKDKLRKSRSWEEFLRRAKSAQQDFLEERDRVTKD